MVTKIFNQLLSTNKIFYLILNLKIKLSLQLILVFIFFSCSSNTEQNIKFVERGKFIDNWTYEFFMERPSKNSFRLWVPENTTVRAILVLAPGGAGNGTGLVNSSSWQKYAEKENLALLGVHVNSNLQTASSNLLFALNKISDARNMDYIASLPILLKGFSHGGRFSYEFASEYSNKTIAYANIKGRISQKKDKLPPGLLITGSDDLPYRNESITNAFITQRELKGFTCFAEEPNTLHEIGNSDTLIKAFFTTILNERLKNSRLKDLNESNYFLGDNSTFQYSKYNVFNQKKELASCLIDEEFALVWQSFVE